MQAVFIIFFSMVQVQNITTINEGFYTGEGNFNIMEYKKEVIFSALIHELVRLNWIYLTM